jgi:hypothetical protein
VLPDEFAGSAIVAKPYIRQQVEQRLREVIAGSRQHLAVAD